MGRAHPLTCIELPGTMIGRAFNPQALLCDLGATPPPAAGEAQGPAFSL
jgi:hypothetical protein